MDVFMDLVMRRSIALAGTEERTQRMQYTVLKQSFSGMEGITNWIITFLADSSACPASLNDLPVQATYLSP